eukprot:SAG31_NODE_6543_length_1982_cov_1.248540_2_plen_73_part_00
MAAASLAASLAALLCATATANLYDVVQKHLIPPPGGCKPWADKSVVRCVATRGLGISVLSILLVIPSCCLLQ